MSLRAALSVLLMVLILPWGAYGAGHAGSDLRTAQGAQTVAATISDAKGAEIKARSACRIAVLPGSPCNPDPVLPPGLAPLTRSASASVAVPLSDWHSQGRSLAPPRAPPRLI
ncbi:hypothetical protein EGN72_12150 [Pseudorhodobacter sp. E13]|uniref:hypothetical protein n=1 Tax=Pseudorhodobacter sp. E13 TaxID=2487931 RepID=UPI000F8E13CD|nr:hypothetical protein [Pseudorhodobacter sp. E13]RUS60028.1 hypothetical protein EGN72_12150 [Pseudorhodobacter sp. E13]